MRRADPPLAAAFAKDPAEEGVLERMNAALAPLERELERDLGEGHPLLIVIGTPRSGTTLLTQLLASCLEIGYVDNLIACFWRAPLVGIRLSRKLLPGPASGSYRSTFGRTDEIDQPHEFGYFWNEHLGYPDLSERGPGHEEHIDWARLRRTLRAMAAAFGAATMFKPFLLTWHLSRAARELPEARFLRMRRDPVDTAVSLLGLRERMLGDREAWASLRPREHAWLAGRGVHEQVAGQVLFLDRAIERGLEHVDPARVLDVPYERLCADPRGVLAAVSALVPGADLAPAREPPDGYVLSRPAAARAADAEPVRAALQRLAAAAPPRGEEEVAP